MRARGPALHAAKDPRRTGRAALLLVLGSVGAVGALCLGFVAAGAPLPEWIVLPGRWIPAIVSLLVMRRYRLFPDVGTAWALRPGGWRGLLLALVIGVFGLLGVYGVQVALGAAGGLVTPAPGPLLGQVLLLALPWALLFSISTFGEEVGWRGHLQGLLRHRGFWPAASLVAGAWLAFHVPLHATLAAQGALPVRDAIAATVWILPAGLFLSALVERLGSVWPAVFAHAAPLSATNLVTDAVRLPDGAYWTFHGLGWALLVVAAAIAAPRRPGG